MKNFERIVGETEIAKNKLWQFGLETCINNYTKMRQRQTPRGMGRERGRGKCFQLDEKRKRHDGNDKKHNQEFLK